MELGRPGNNRVRKRKAETQDNERLSKRLSLLNLERNGQKLYVPVEAPSTSPSQVNTTSNNDTSSTRASRRSKNIPDDSMQLDDTKHKVYIYDLDAELSDSDTSDDGKLVFLPDISKHLRETRIPPSVLANRDGELAGMNKELVLYNVPSALSVPEAQDSVRRAIIDARARIRAKNDDKSTGTRVEEGKNVENGTAIDGRSFWGHALPSSKSQAAFWASSDALRNEAIIPTIPDTPDIDDPDAMDLG